jgi:hypothetical protein
MYTEMHCQPTVLPGMHTCKTRTGLHLRRTWVLAEHAADSSTACGTHMTLVEERGVFVCVTVPHTPACEELGAQMLSSAAQSIGCLSNCHHVLHLLCRACCVPCLQRPLCWLCVQACPQSPPGAHQRLSTCHQAWHICSACRVPSCL